MHHDPLSGRSEQVAADASRMRTTATASDSPRMHLESRIVALERENSSLRSEVVDLKTKPTIAEEQIDVIENGRAPEPLQVVAFLYQWKTYWRVLLSAVHFFIRPCHQLILAHVP